MPRTDHAAIRAQRRVEESGVRNVARRDAAVVLALTAVGAALRASTIDTRGLWLDETGSITQATGSAWETILSQIGGTHPPFFHLLMHFWMSLFGTGEVAIRSFALVFGVAAIPLAFWAGTIVFDRTVGLISAAILTFSPFSIWYSQEARMYTMLLFFALLSVGFFTLALERNSVGSWLGYFAASLMGAFTHYLFVFLILGQVLYFVIFEVMDREIRLGREGECSLSWRRPWRVFADVPTAGPWLASNAVVAVCMILWAKWAVFFRPGGSALVRAVASTGLGYGAPPPAWAIRFNDVVETLVELLVGSHSSQVMSGLVAMWPLIIYIAMLAMGGGRYMTRRVTLMLCSMLGILVVWGFGQWQGVVLLSRYLTPMSAPALILAASVIAQVPLRGRRVILAAGIVVSLIAFGSQSFDPNSVLRYQNREVIQYVGEHQEPGDTIIFEPFYIDNLINYYLPGNLVAYGFPRYGDKGQFRDTDQQIFQDLARIIGPARRVWVIRSFQNVPSIGYQSYKTDQWFLRNGYEMKQHVVMNKAEFSRWESVRTTGTPVPEGVLP